MYLSIFLGVIVEHTFSAEKICPIGVLQSKITHQFTIRSREVCTTAFGNCRFSIRIFTFHNND